MRKIEEHFEGILTELGEDKDREGLLDTPHRAAKAMRYLTSGYHTDIDAIINSAIFSTDNDDMVIVKNIEFYSLCEHHILPFFGTCHIAYLPQGKVLGLSKVARIVEAFSRRLQIQEQLTHQISTSIMEAVDAAGVGVIVEAKHMCMMMRGIEKQHSAMKTSSMLGEFREDPKTRQEFLMLVQ